MAIDSQRVVKKTLRLDPDKLAKLQKLFETMLIVIINGLMANFGERQVMAEPAARK